jgi:hypothetical protein
VCTIDRRRRARVSGAERFGDGSRSEGDLSDKIGGDGRWRPGKNREKAVPLCGLTLGAVVRLLLEPRIDLVLDLVCNTVLSFRPKRTCSARCKLDVDV